MDVWVVDADRSTCESIADAFAKVEWFRDAESFLARIDRAGEPDVVVAEVRLPGIAGIELIETLRGRGLAMPVILVCADADVATAVDAIRRGAADFFEKPVPGGLLVGCIRRLADGTG